MLDDASGVTLVQLNRMLACKLRVKRKAVAKALSSNAKVVLAVSGGLGIIALTLKAVEAHTPCLKFDLPVVISGELL
jgi:hypothetical protein